jgi:hypothetical protein
MERPRFDPEMAAHQQNHRGDEFLTERLELMPLHVWMAPALQEIVIGEAQSSLAVMCPAC